MEIHRVKQLFRYDFMTKEESMGDPWKTVVLNDSLGMYDWALSAKFFLNKGVSVWMVVVVGSVWWDKGTPFHFTSL